VDKNAAVLIEGSALFLQRGEFGGPEVPEVKPANRMPEVIVRGVRAGRLIHGERKKGEITGQDKGILSPVQVCRRPLAFCA
jgi:hypothetical protein